MSVTLNDDEHVARGVLGRNEPRRLGVAAPAADRQSRALPERVEGKPAVRSERRALRSLDRARLIRQKPREKLGKRALADEANARTVGLVEDRQPRAARALAHRALLQLPERHQGALEVVGRGRT